LNSYQSDLKCAFALKWTRVHAFDSIYRMYRWVSSENRFANWKIGHFRDKLCKFNFDFWPLTMTLAMYGLQRWLPWLIAALGARAENGGSRRGHAEHPRWCHCRTLNSFPRCARTSAGNYGSIHVRWGFVSGPFHFQFFNRHNTFPSKAKTNFKLQTNFGALKLKLHSYD